MRRKFIALVCAIAAASCAHAQLYWVVDQVNEIREIDPTRGTITRTLQRTGNSLTVGAAPLDEITLLYSTPQELRVGRTDGGIELVLDSRLTEALAFNPATNTIYQYINNSFNAINRSTLSVTPLAFDTSNGEVEGMAYDRNRNVVWGVASNGSIMQYSITGNSWTTVGNIGFGVDDNGLAYNPIGDILYHKARFRTTLEAIDGETLEVSTIATGLSTNGGGLAYVTPQAVLDAVDVGVEPFFSNFRISTQGSSFDSFLAVWDGDGNIVTSADDFFSFDAAVFYNAAVTNPLIQQVLPPGRYVVGVIRCCATPTRNFRFQGAANFTGAAPLAVGDAGPDTVLQFDGESAKYATFEVRGTTDVAQFAPKASVQLGTVAEPFESVVFDFTASTAPFARFAVFAEDTSRLRVRDSASDVAEQILSPGRYFLIAVPLGIGFGGESFAAFGEPSIGGRFTGTIGSASVDIEIPDGGIRVIEFQVGSDSPSDLDGDGTVDVFDLIAFLQAFSTALN